MQTIPETMMYLLFLFVGLPALSQGQIDCTVDNGGCSHYCIDRTATADVCGCECYYQLGEDDKTCQAITPCTVDMLWMFDFANGILNICPVLSTFLAFGFPLGDTSPFSDFRNEVASHYSAFSPEIISGDYRVATVITDDLSSGSSGLEILNHYGDVDNVTVLQTQITDIEVDSGVICGAGNVFSGLYNSFDHSSVIAASRLNINGEGDATTTTRIAVVAMVTPLDESAAAPNATVLHGGYAATIHDYYDQVFVIGKLDQSQLDSGFQNYTDPQLRRVACNSPDADPCIYLFYSDGINDDGLSFTRNVVQPMIDRTACISRKTINVHTTTCNDYDITISIPSCMLGGLTRSDLQLNDDASCDGDAMAAVSGENLVFTVDYDACSPVVTTTTVDGVEYVTITQNVVTKDGVAVAGKVVNFGASCTFPSYTDEQLGINPDVAELSGFVEEVGSFGFELRLSEDDSYTGYYSFSNDGVTIDVLQRMYFLATGNLPSNMKLIVKDIIASSSTDRNQAPIHAIMTDQCEKDDTFGFGDITQDTVKFQFQMFEFSNTVNLPNGAKTPVYIHVTLHACDNSDTSPDCTQECPTRKRRDNSAAERPIHGRTIGPFYPGRASSISSYMKSDTVDVYSNTTPEQFDFNPSKVESDLSPSGFRIYIITPGLGTVLLLFLLVVSTMVILAFVSKCILKLSPPKIVHCESLDCKLTKVERSWFFTRLTTAMDRSPSVFASVFVPLTTDLASGGDKMP